MTSARSIIAVLRDGGKPSKDDLRWFAAGLASGEVSDAQGAAFAMAVLLKGLSDEGRAALTLAMRDSGEVLAWDLPGPVIDKHSTGGIGDCVSLLLAPALAVCGAYVPMISGRGLGHTGGTLDKLESIPGFRTALSTDQLRAQVGQSGCAIVAASADLAPADRRLYAIRDVTATVESIDLITASVLSKKLAAGLDALVLDVKVGSGAFMRETGQAQALAQALVTTARRAGCRCAALITDMDQPLARSAGNALEVIEAMEVLTDSAANPRLFQLTAELGGELLALAGLAVDAEDGTGMVADVLESGAAAEAFGRMVAAQGGPRDFVECWTDRLPSAPIVREVHARQAGYVTRIDTFMLGEAVVHLGGGRLQAQDRINPGVGLSEMAELAGLVDRGQPLARVHAASDAAADAAVARVLAAYEVGEVCPEVLPLIRQRIS